MSVELPGSIWDVKFTCDHEFKHIVYVAVVLFSATFSMVEGTEIEDKEISGVLENKMKRHLDQ